MRSGPVGYLPQEPEARPGETVLAYLGRRTGVGPAGDELDALGARLGAEPGLVGAHAEALDRFLALGGGDFDARAAAALAEVGLSGRAGNEVGRLSGGEAARAALAAILLARFDVFCLDEPTNNLDFAGLERLERFLDGLRAGVVLVSHDRAFLDRTVTRVVELEAETRRMHEYAGSWSDYEHVRRLARERHERPMRPTSTSGTATRHCSSTGRTRRAPEPRWRAAAAPRRSAGRSSRRGTTSRGSRRSRSRGRRGASSCRSDLPIAAAAWSRSSPGGRRARDVRLGPLDLELRFGDRLAVVGPNGSGKSTLIEALLGRLPLARGSLRVGPSVASASSTRPGRPSTPRDPCSTALSPPGLAAVDARTLLAKFALGADDVIRPAPSLSAAGGEGGCGPDDVVGPQSELGEQRARVDRRQPGGGDKAVEQGSRGVEGRPGLVELAEANRRPDPQRAAGERQPAEQRLDQRGLARAVRPDDGEAVTEAKLEVDRPEAERPTLDNRTSELRDQAAAAIGRSERQLRRQGDHGFSTSSSPAR